MPRYESVSILSQLVLRIGSSTMLYICSTYDVQWVPVSSHYGIVPWYSISRLRGPAESAISIEKNYFGALNSVTEPVDKQGFATIRPKHLIELVRMCLEG